MAKLVQVIEVEAAGLLQYWSLDGKLLAEVDPNHITQNDPVLKTRPTAFYVRGTTDAGSSRFYLSEKAAQEQAERSGCSYHGLYLRAGGDVES